MKHLCVLLLTIQHFGHGFAYDVEKHEELVRRIRWRSFGEPDKRVGQALMRWTPDSKGNPEEHGTYYQGDILIRDDGFNVATRNGKIDTHYRWPKGVVPYVIDDSFTSEEKAVILRAMDSYRDYTCINFVPHDGLAQDYVSVENGKSGCWASVGRLSGKQTINLQSESCLYQIGTPIHEMMHTLGFEHEHCRLDRDDWVTILYQNIQPGAESQFEKAANTTAFNVAYDYGSVLHYSAYAFSKNDQVTIYKKWDGPEMGQRNGFSANDIKKIQLMYECVGNVSFMSL